MRASRSRQWCLHAQTVNRHSNPPQVQWNDIIDQADQIHKAKASLKPMPGCLNKCGNGSHCMKTRRAFSIRKPDSNDVSEHESDSSKGICLRTAAGDSDNCVMNIDGAFTWVQIPCAVDRGACAHVSPPGVRGFEVCQAERFGGVSGKCHLRGWGVVDNTGNSNMNESVFTVMPRS